MKTLLYFMLFVLMTGPVTQSFAQLNCNAAFGWQANPLGNNLLNVNFTNNSTASNISNPGGYIYSTGTINFGDGSATQPLYSGSTSHNYPSPGNYTVTVTIHSEDTTSGTLTCNDTETGTVTVGYSACATSVAAVNNGGGSYTFTASNPAGTSGMNYSWNFGDGTSATGNPATHSYPNGGNFYVTLTSTGGGCTSSNGSTFVSVAPPCSQLQASFNHNNNGLITSFSNSSTGCGSLNMLYCHSDWFFGDGSASVMDNSGPNHTYAAYGTYNVMMVNHWMDSIYGSPSGSLYCTDTVISPITVYENFITGYVFSDSVTANIPNPNTIKVWLILHDVTANTLTAVDSTEIGSFNTAYHFYNPPSGDYLVKAAALNQNPGTAGWLPTYHLNSTYWSGATNIAHAGGFTTNKHIHLQGGIATSGPGFIGGNISMGAGRGTGTGIQGMLVYLRNSSNQLITSAVTDADGDYSFSNLAIGTYSVYPEAINYNTIPFNTIQVTAAQSHVEAIDFEQTADEIKPKSATTGITKVSEKDGLKIYPNPAKNLLTIESKNGLFNQVKIMNAVGQMIKEVSLKNGINKVDISEMNTGIYYLLISGDNDARSMKMVKQ